jgi:hypothetical protein
MRDCSEQGKSAPENRAQNNDHLAGIAVGQRPGEGCRDHVEAKKGAGQVAHLCVGEMEFVLHQRLHGKQNRTVDVVKEVQRREQDERGPRIKFRRGHSGEEIYHERFTALLSLLSGRNSAWIPNEEVKSLSQRSLRKAAEIAEQRPSQKSSFTSHFSLSALASVLRSP